MTTLNYKLIDGDFINFHAFGDLVLENDGSFTQEYQSIIFEKDDNEIAVNYNVYVEGEIEYEKFDFEYQGGKYPVVNGITVTITDVYINEEKVDVDYDTLFELENEIKKYIKN